jgi:hypothetical protein
MERRHRLTVSAANRGRDSIANGRPWRHPAANNEPLRVDELVGYLLDRAAQVGSAAPVTLVESE